MSDAIGSLLDYVENLDKGQLRTCSLIRDGDADWVACSFSLDHHPGVEYTFRYPISAATGVEPQTGPQLAVSIFMASIMEGVQDRTEAVDGKISLD